jgi:hypothetical protein
MPGIYNRESLFLKNIVDGRREIDMASIDFPSLERSKGYFWTFVRREEQCRPDLLSYRLYGTEDLWWFVMWLNGIMDPWHDLMPDVALKYLPIEQIDNAFKYIKMKRVK